MSEHKRRTTRPTALHILNRIGFQFASENCKLGSGQYSTVYKGYYKDANRSFAIKVIDLERISNVFKQKFLPREIEIWRQLNHKHHVFLFKDFEKEGYQFEVMELAEGGDLLTYTQNNGPVPEIRSRSWMLQLIDAIQYLHGKGIAHRDLKLENILLFKGGVLKISDYGFCKKSDDLSCTFCGSKSYSPPEILQGIHYDPFKADIWSLGVIGFIILTNRMPFREDVDNHQIVDSQLNGRYRFPSKLGISARCKATIVKLLTFKAAERPSIFECPRLPWFVDDCNSNTGNRHATRG